MGILVVGLLKPSFALFWCCYPMWGSSTIQVSLKEEMKENGPFRPHLKVKQLLEKLLFLLLILSIAFCKALVYEAKTFFFPSL